MKTIGLIGGLSWVSTHEYYKRLNVEVSNLLGGASSAKILIESFNFADILPYQLSDQNHAERRLLIDAAQRLDQAGADVILICSCTTNMLVDSVQSHIGVPLLNIVDCIARHIEYRGYSKVGLLGTKRVMYQRFFRDQLTKRNIESIVPSKDDGEEINRIIYEELIINDFREESTRKLHGCINKFEKQGADAVILGCTELPLLVPKRSGELTLVDSIQVHIDDALQFVFPMKEVCYG